MSDWDSLRHNGLVLVLVDFNDRKAYRVACEGNYYSHSENNDCPERFCIRDVVDMPNGNPVFDMLVKLAVADSNGCCKTAEDDEEMNILDALKIPRIKECLGVKMPPRILTGNDLI